MKSPAFQIRVVILGHVSVGKTTVLNALLGDKFSEVAKKRTTAGINHFKIVSSMRGNINEITPEADDDGRTSKKAEYDEACDLTSDDMMPAEEALAKITAENVELRKKNSIQECTLNVELAEPLIPMQPNTNLVITDVPGVNEAGSSKMYLNYLEKVWDDFDCVIVVMDADQGVNTEEQVQLLEFVKTNLKKYKSMPTFILCNKVDDPHDEELMALVDEVRGKVNETFKDIDVKPTLLHISAHNAFAYRNASRLTRENMHEKLTRECLDKIGFEEIGRVKWRRMSEEKKYDLVYEVVSDKAQYKERLSLSNFDKFLEVLSSTLGGSVNQANLIEEQLKVQLKKLIVSFEDEALFADSLGKIFDCSYTLGKPTGHLRAKFWALYSSCEKRAFMKFAECPTNVTHLQKPMKELQSYGKGLHLKFFASLTSSDGVVEETEKNADEEKIMNAMRGLVSRQITIMSQNEAIPSNNSLISLQSDPWKWRQGENSSYNNHYHHHHSSNAKKSCWCKDGIEDIWESDESKRPEAGLYTSHWEWKRLDSKWHNKYDVTDTRDGTSNMKSLLIPTSWRNVQPEDWCAMICSVLLLKYNKHFCQDFSNEIVKLEMRKCCTTRFSDANMTGWRGMKEPTSLSDPNHFGCLAQMYCDFKESLSK